ncbi:MAG TPA: lipoprotein-releasing ABC transporter permease subunit [Myxococcota bacterium]|nr:lipoprotein-releasing ABC transporter permease subunit [Myxococcota bacterium]
MAILESLWGALTAAGGGVALGLIVAIALGINAMSLLFAGSAVVALERFARVSKRRISLFGFGALWSLAIAALLYSLRAEELSGSTSRERLLAFGSGLLACALLVGFGTAAVRLALRRVRGATLAVTTSAVLGLGTALVLGGSGRVVYAAAPTAVALIGALWLLWRRGAQGGPGDTERMLWTLCAALAAGVALAAVLPEAEERVAAAGGLLLALLGGVILFGLLPAAAAGLFDTRQTAEWFIAIRYLVAKRRQTFISIITGICVVGIAAGVWLIITVLSVMNGFERTWRDEIIGNRAHFTVQSGLGPIKDYREALEAVAATPGVVAASPYVDAEGMVRGDRGEIMAVRVRGVDPDRVGLVTDLREDIKEGSLEALRPEAQQGDEPAILIGSQLAGALGVTLGDSLVLISPFGGPQTPLGPAPRLARFEVAGIFQTSFFQYDEVYTYVNLHAAQEFRRTDDVVDGIEARTTDFYRSRKVADAVQEALGFPYYTRDWKEFFPAFFQALKSERVMMFILLSMIMVVAAFSIVSTLIMMIMEKSSDIAILKTMGAEDDAIERIFALEGTLIGLVGTALGVIAGISVTAQIGWIQHQIESAIGIDTLPASVYQFSTLPAELDPGQIVFAVSIALVLALGATLLPSRQAARLDPVEALRDE